MTQRNAQMNTFITLAVIELMAGFAIRAVALMRLPFQWLEAFNLTLVHLSLADSVVARGVEMRKWLSPPLLSLFQPEGPEGPWVARMVSVLMGVVCIAISIDLGRRLGSRRIGLLAGALYALLPLATFHERQGLADILLATLTSLATLFIVRMARRPRLSSALLFGIVLAGAYLTKITALPYALLPGWAILLLTPRDQWLRAILLTLVGIVLAVGLVSIPYALYVQHNPEVYPNVPEALIHQIRILTEGESATTSFAEHLQTQLRDLLDVLNRYIGWGLLALVLIGAAFSVRSSRWRAFAFLAVPAIVFVTPSIVSQSSATNARDPFMAARYILPNMVPLMVMAALACMLLFEQASQRWSRRLVWPAAGGVALMVLLPWLLFDLSLYGDPARINMTVVDDLQYRIGQASGYGFQEISAHILAMGQERGTPIHVLDSAQSAQIRAAVGQRENSVHDLTGRDDQLRTVAGWLARGEPVVVFEGGRDFPISGKTFGAQLDPVAEIDSAWGVMRLYEITAAEGALAEAIYAATTADPAKLEANYQALAPALQAPDAVFVFPANHAAPLERLVGRGITPMSILTWPLNTLPADLLSAVPDGQQVAVVLVDETLSDPNRIIERALLRRWYRLDEAWDGPLHRIQYVSGSGALDLPPINGVFEGDIQLVSGGSLEAAPAAGQIMRFALTWLAGQPIRDSFKVFVHLAAPDGSVKAQYDGFPGAGLLPMTIWEPDQPVTDRFALRLPADLPDGIYELRVGIYLPDSGPRLPVIAADQHGGDYIVIGTVQIAAPTP